MKKWIVRGVLALVLLLLVVIGIVFFSLNSIVKKGVETVGPQLTKTEVRLESAKLSPLSGNGQLTGLLVGNPQGYKTPSAIKVGDIKVGLKVSSVFSDNVVVNEVNIQGPEITFEGGLSGNNLSQILDNLNSASAGDTNKPAPASKSEKRIQVKDLVVRGGKVNVSVTMLGGKSLTVNLPEVHLQNIGTENNGVTAAELVRQVLKPLLTEATKAATEAIASAGKDIQNVISKDATQQVDKVTKGVKDLFKK